MSVPISRQSRVSAFPTRLRSRAALARGVALGIFTVAGTTVATAAQAQETTLIPPTLPDDFDRGRNVSVLEKPRPDYDPIGIPLNSFNIFPRIDIGAGYSDNLYLSNADRIGSAFVSASPQFRAVSDWSRNYVAVRGGALLRRYIDNPLRNENAWNLAGLGRLDIGNDYDVTGEAQVARQFETPFSGEVASDLAVLSNYLRGFESLRGEYKSGQTRLVLALDRTTFNFSDVRLASGGRIDQSDRDREVLRATGQAEYAFTPSASVYGQLTYGNTSYDRSLLNGQPNRDSNAVRVIGGLNMDLAGLLRGSIGVGYVWRNYDSPIYPDVSGVSAEVKLEYFPSELTTYTFQLRRVIEDSSLGTSNAYFDNRAVLRVDHELLRNLLLNGQAELALQDYIGTTDRNTVYRITAGARYLSSPRLAFDLNFSYGGRTVHGANQGSEFNEFRAQIGITLQR